MVAIGRAIVSRPEVMLLDEPTLGLAPLVIREIAGALKKINQEGVTILVAEQNASFALGIIKLAYVLEVGNVILSGPQEKLLRDGQLDRAYFGK